MCMNKFDAEKTSFWQIYSVFNLAIFGWLHQVNNGWKGKLCEINSS